MKAAFIMLFLGTGIALAGKAYSQEYKLSLRLSEISIRQAISEIEKHSDYVFVWTDNIEAETNRKVSIQAKDEELETVLDRMFVETTLSYRRFGKQVILYLDKTGQTDSPAAPTSQQNKRRISGTVTDARGEAIIGANIIEKGTTNGIITDVDGKFSIETAPNAILVVSYIGYNTQEAPTANKSSLKITLTENTLGLEEVVVVGYGTQRKTDVTGAIASVNESTLKEVPGSNVSQSMQGRLAGVNIQLTSTRPGADTQIRIRGTRSLAAENDPLIIVDGIPFLGNLNDITPEDVKSVDILKDASSTAIYGSRGANGVIIITTNRGSHIGKPRVSYNGYYGLSTIAKKYEMFDAEEFIKVRELSGYQAGSPYLPQEEQYFSTGKSFDWQDEMYQTAHVTSQDLSFMAGSEAIQGSVGLNYYNATSVLPGQDFSRYSIRGNNDIRMNNWLKIGFNTQESFNLTKGEGVDIVVLYEMLGNSPLVNPYDSNGKAITQPLAPREDA